VYILNIKHHHKTHCGSWLASDEAGSVNINVTDMPPSLASQLAQF
jgi:hypothetical protein